jgi:hypothetical protein
VINRIIGRPLDSSDKIGELTDKDKAKDENEETMTDECLAELLYLKCMIDMTMQHKDSDRALSQFEDCLMAKPGNEANFTIVKYYVRTMI